MSLSTLYPTTRPSLLLDFVNRRRLDSRVTFTRASSATYFDQLGVLQTAGNDVPRFDFDPATLAARGLLIEEQRTNSIRNNTMQGAVAGTPGTLPTNWATFTALTGLTQSIVGTGTENGITYIDVRLSGTPSGAGQWQIAAEGTTSVVASSGQAWTFSTYYKLAAGSLAGISTFQVAVSEYNAVGGYLGGTIVTVAAPSGVMQRASASRVFNNAATARAHGTIFFNLDGAAIDITLRIGLPQLEQGAFATSVIPTTTAAATRSADVASMTGANFSSWYNATQGTFYTEALFGPSAPTNTGVISAYQASSPSTNRLSIRVANTIITSAGVDVANFFPVGTANTTAKYATTYEVNNFAQSVNGGASAVDTSGAVPIGINELEIGGVEATAAFVLNGHIRRIAYYPSRLTNAQLQALTAS